MKSFFQIAMASLVLGFFSLAPASALAAGPSGGHHGHSQTYHDRTPTVHTHSSHPHRG